MPLETGGDGVVTALAHEVRIPAQAGVELPGTLIVPRGARGVVVFAHGSGSSRMSPRNVAVAEYLRRPGHIGTLLFDLLTPDEDREYRTRFDIDLLTERLMAATRWLLERPGEDSLSLGYFGASTGAAAALRAAAVLGPRAAAVVSRGGRPDLAGDALSAVVSPTLLIVGGHDPQVIQLNEQARRMLPQETRTEIVPGATHLFDEPGAMEQVSALALEWFEAHL